MAVKIPTSDITMTKKQDRKALEEAQLMMLMSLHPNCLTFHGYVSEGGFLALVSELADSSLDRLLGDEVVDEMSTK